MDNYKIKVKDEAESKEAQELFFELGFQWHKEDKGVFWETTTGFIFANDGTKLLFGGVFGDADTYTPITLPQLRDLVAQSKLKDQGLISGAEALRALADGKSIEWQDDNGIWWPLGVGWTWNQIVNSLNGIQALRLKPQTIKLELDLPKPFEPKDGDICFVIDADQTEGFRSFTYWEDSDFHKKYIQFGAWRTEVEIKQVVEQLRKIRGTNS